MPNDTASRIDELRAAHSRITNAGFDRWLAKPEIKLMVSMLPPAENPDLVTTLLKAAFVEGSEIGVGALMAGMMDEINKKLSKP